MIKIFVILLCLLAFYQPINAQDRISADRPDQTESAWLTPRHYFQAEFGFNYLVINPENKVFTLPDMLLKYGVADRFELQLAGQYISVQQKSSAGTETNTGIVPMELGFRVGLWDQKKFIPKTSLIIRTGFPLTASEVFKTDHLPGLVLLAMENAFSEHIALGYNIGIVFDGDSPNPLWIYSASLGFDLGKKWDGFIEGFGAAQNDNGALNSIDTGVGFYINDNMKLDAYYGKRLSREADKDFFGVGYSFRINTKRNEKKSSAIFSKY
jgi:outer membrane putative beta-barrel porin/alpha-amylase